MLIRFSQIQSRIKLNGADADAGAGSCY